MKSVLVRTFAMVAFSSTMALSALADSTIKEQNSINKRSFDYRILNGLRQTPELHKNLPKDFEHNLDSYLDWPESDVISLNKLTSNISAATFLESQSKVSFNQTGDDVTFKLPKQSINQYNSVIKVNLAQPFKIL